MLQCTMQIACNVKLFQLEIKQRMEEQKCKNKNFFFTTIKLLQIKSLHFLTLNQRSGANSKTHFVAKF